MRFPVYVLVRDCGEVRRFSSIEEMQKHLEAIDIDNEEFEAWDADGTALQLRTQKPVWIKVEEGKNDRKSLAGVLLSFAAAKGLKISEEPSSASEIESLLDYIYRQK
jgi:hypothetical protein